MNKPGLCLSTRLNLAFICFLGCIITYALRTNVSFAIVCMVNNTAIEAEQTELNENYSVTVKVQECPRDAVNTTDVERIEGEFVWDKATQGYVLSAFFWGYMSSQILGGWVATHYGAKLILGITALSGAVLTILSPAAAHTSVTAFIGIRVLLGFFQGVTFPAMHAMWSIWAPPLERSVLTGISYAGSQIGNVIVMPLSGFLCKYGPFGGWQSIFYVLGIAAFLWCILWFFYVADTPHRHRSITHHEKNYIVDSLKHSIGDHSAKKPTVPWRAILTSRAIWAIFVGHFAGDWGAYMMATSLPSFMNDILGFDLTSMGLISSIPYVLYFACTLSCGGADFIQHKGWLNTLNTRRLAMIVALGGQALFLNLIGYCKCGQEVLVIILITLSIGISGFQYAGFVVNYLDVAPAYAGTILGIGNTLSGLAGIFAPLVMGWMTPQGTKEEWQNVFLLTGAVLVGGAAFFCFFASGELQPWAKTSKPSESVLLSNIESDKPTAVFEENVDADAHIE